MDISAKQAANELLAAQDIVLISHKSPDGDTLGSSFALYWALRALGKRARVVCSDAFPAKYDYFLNEQPDEAFPPQFICAVDVGDEKLFGPGTAQYIGRVQLCIDHHQTNTDYAKMRCLNWDMAATAELVYCILGEMKAPITPKIADCLFTGITTDTGCFRYANVTSETHRVAAELIEAGADAAEINRIMFEQKSVARMAVEKLVMESLGYDFEGQCAYICISKDILKRSGACEEELEGVSAIPRRIEGVQVGVTYNEREDGYKVSVRTAGEINASLICRALGGGGHQRAAGCFIEGDYQTARAKMHAVLADYLDH